MRKDQINRKEMFDSVNLFLDSNATKWSSVPKITETKTKLSALIFQVEAAAQKQDESRIYLGSAKQQLKKTLADKSDILNDSLEVMALLNGNTELALRMSDNFSTLYALKNTDFIARVREIIQAATDHSEELTTGYGVTSEQLDDLKADADQFAEMNGLPRAYRISSVQATKQLETLFTEINELLTNGLDKLMTIFRRSDPQFYNGYLAAREVVND